MPPSATCCPEITKCIEHCQLWFTGASAQEWECPKLNVYIIYPCRAAEMPFIASMGIYVVKASIMKELLLERFPMQHDFGSDIIPGACELGFHIQVRSRELTQPCVKY